MNISHFFIRRPIFAGVLSIAIFIMGLVIVNALIELRKLVHPLMDGSLPAEDRAALERVLQGNANVRGYHYLRTREVGPDRFVELHVLLDDELSFVTAHEIAEQIEDDLRAVLGGATVSIHFEPYHAEVEHRSREHGEG